MEESIIKQEKCEDTNITKPIQEQEVIIMEELEECKTPTCSRSKIPIAINCPPAPRKKRKPSLSSHSCFMKRSLASQFKYVVKAEEVDSFFQSMFKLTKVINKRCM
ncbi:unnamed protein product [Trifolium pratense]|uniref:Uncharacterized protein n=1 Tax=Trifolium pratense TaxID=57577 RepID=A0ACB0KDG2_TRIPR|nr:unnamed protein product [Trifolium pratense]